MSELSHLENHERPPQSEADIRTVLEKGEIVHLETLKGYDYYQVATIKDDGKALFREESDIPEMGGIKKRFHRNDLEMLAAEVDEILGFNLVPPVARRTLGGVSGTFQQFLENAKTAHQFLPEDWSALVEDLELTKAAVFDYLIDAHDRGGQNFLVDKDARKIWLIDHDYFMMVDRKYGSDILRTATASGPVVLSEEIVEALRGLLAKIDSILAQTEKPEIKEIIAGIKDRTGTLITTRTLGED